MTVTVITNNPEDMMRRVIPLLLLVFVVSTASEAIVVRGDIRSLASVVDEKDYPEVVPILNGRAAGTLIDDKWILTAAHVGQIVANSTDSDRDLTINGLVRKVDQVFMHPSWNEERLGEPDVIDLALLRLDRPVDDAQVAPLYCEGGEKGKVITIFGWGGTGDGTSTELVKDRLFRRGENIIDEVTPRIRFDFDEPTSPDATEYEAVSGPGDSGGPAFIDIQGISYLVGVSSFQQDEVAPGLYGVIENYERVSRHLDWINGVVRD